MQLGFRHIRVQALQLQIPVEQLTQLLRLLRADLVQRHPRQGDGHFHAHCRDLVVQQGLQQLVALVQGQEFQGAHRAGAQYGVVVVEHAGHCLDGLAATALGHCFQGGGAPDGRGVRIVGQLRQRRHDAAVSLVKALEGPGDMAAGIAEVYAPAPQGGYRPLGVAITVALVAGIGRPHGDAQVGAGNPHAVVAARIHAHVGGFRHVAVGAEGAARVRRMMVMGLGIVFLRLVALGTDAVVRRPQGQAVGLVAVAADHAGLVHLALQEGAVDIDLVQDLAIGVVQRGLGQCQAVGGQQVGAVVVLAQGAATRVAAATAVHLGAGIQGLAAPGDGYICGKGPLAPLGQRGGETPVGRIFELLLPGQLQVLLARAVTGLATDIDFLVGGVESTGLGIVILLQVGAVAFRAAAVPVLVVAGPVQRVLVINGFIGIQVVPALSALVRRSGIPGDAQRLQAAAGQGQQILLQGIDPEHVLDGEVGQFAVLAVSAHLVQLAVAIKTRGDAIVGEGGVVEIAQHGLGGGQLHGQVVVRAPPVVILRGVAAFAAVAAGIGVAGGAQQQRCGDEEAGKHGSSWAIRKGPHSTVNACPAQACAIRRQPGPASGYGFGGWQATRPVGPARRGSLTTGPAPVPRAR